MGFPGTAAAHLSLRYADSFTHGLAAQAARMETPEKKKADALASVSGFAFHIQDAIRNTPAEAVSRSRIVDRCADVCTAMASAMTHWPRSHASPGSGCAVKSPLWVSISTALDAHRRATGVSVDGAWRRLPLWLGALTVTIRPCRWLKPGKAFGNGCITVVGDALHPMTPSLGQGGCIALEVRLRSSPSMQSRAWHLLVPSG